MISRIATMLLVTTVCATAFGGELFQASKFASGRLKGSAFEVALFDDAIVVNSTGTQLHSDSAGSSKVAAKLRDLLATGEVKTVVSLQRCKQEIVIRVLACSVAADSTVYDCDFTLLSARLKKGSGGCEL